MKEIEKVLSSVNSHLKKYKTGGWIQVERIPGTLETDTVMSLEEYVDAVFNRAIINYIPEFETAQRLLGGHLFKCHLVDPDEPKKRFKEAVAILVDEKSIINPDENLINELKRVQDYLGGTQITFNSVKIKIIYTIS